MRLFVYSCALEANQRKKEATALPPHVWNDIYEGCPFPLRVDYIAKRLAVTSINHAYYSAAIMTGRDNPFAVGIQWELSKFHVIYDVCDLYMEHNEGLGIGVYSFDSAPIPHPFCRCNWYVTEGERSLEDIAKELYRWEQGESNPRLDKAFGAWGGDTRTTKPQSYQTGRDTIKNIWLGSTSQSQEVITLIGRANEILEKTLPSVYNRIAHIELVPLPEKVVAQTGLIRFSDRFSMQFNTSLWSSVDKIKSTLASDVRQGWMFNADDPSVFVAHEAGHLAIMRLALSRCDGRRDQFKAAYNQLIQEAYTAAFNDETYDEIIEAIKSELCAQAVSLPGEYPAQCFAAYYYGKGKHPIAGKVVAYYLELLKGVIT